MSLTQRTAKSLEDVLHASLQILIVCLLVPMILGAEMCTKSVPRQREPSKKVHVLRRVPALCSNWEKAWSWITKKDCGTKYKLDWVDLPSQKMVTYRAAKVCCEGDTKCKSAEANGLEASGLNISDEKFLAIVLGSTAAALFVLILVISISLCRKKKQCTLLCEERRHIYANAEDAEESSELQGQKGCEVDEEETENKVCESEYAEINDSGLPRYTDIFKGVTAEEDPFTKASAPPISTYESRDGNKGRDPTNSNVKEVLQGTADILERECQQPSSQEDTRTSDSSYYNVASRPRAGEQAASSTGHQEAVLNLTKDDPAVLTGGASSASPPSTPVSRPKPQTDSISCDVNGEMNMSIPPSPAAPRSGPEKKSNSSTSAYETLAQPSEKDAHEYQTLNNRKDTCKNNTEMNCISKEADAVDFIDDDNKIVDHNGHAEVAMDC